MLKYSRQFEIAIHFWEERIDSNMLYTLRIFLHASFPPKDWIETQNPINDIKTARGYAFSWIATQLTVTLLAIKYTKSNLS